MKGGAYKSMGDVGSFPHFYDIDWPSSECYSRAIESLISASKISSPKEPRAVYGAVIIAVDKGKNKVCQRD